MKHQSKWIILHIWLMVAIPSMGLAQIRHTSIVSPIKIKQDVNRILQSPDYRWKKPKPSILDKIGKLFILLYKKIAAFIHRLLPKTNLPSASVNPIMARILMILLSVILVALLAWLIAALIKGGSYNRKRINKKHAKVENSKLEEEPVNVDQPEEMLTFAKSMFDKGDWRRSYRYAFLAILMMLDRKGLIQYEKSRTNGEYLRTIGRHKEIYPMFKVVCQDFDVKWYGHAPIDSGSCKRVLDGYEDMSRMIGDEAPTV